MNGARTRRGFLKASAGAAAATSLAPLARAAQLDAPNVLVIVIDTLRTDYVGAYGGKARTPAIDAIAREGLRFTRCYPEAMPTVPARNSILSGQRRFPFRDWRDVRGLIAQPGWAPLSEPERAFPALLRQAGWWTAYVTDNPFLGHSHAYRGFRRTVDSVIATGGQVGGDKPVSSVPRAVLRHWLHPRIAHERERIGKYLANSRPWESETNTYAARVFSDAMRTLEKAAQRRPFALVVDTYEPHEPWTPPNRFLKLYGDPDWRGPEPAMPRYSRTENWLPRGIRGEVLQRMRDLYAAEVTMTDFWLGLLMEKLHSLGLQDDTVIVLVADHGILLGEHGWTGKISVALHPALTRVPLIVVDPRRGRRERSSDWFASTHDVAPTIMSLAGLPIPKRMEGVDLSRRLRGKKLPERPYAYGGYKNSFYIRTDRWAMWADNRPRHFQLYDLDKDPGEFDNVVRGHPRLARELYEKVRSRAGGRLPYYD